MKPLALIFFIMGSLSGYCQIPFLLIKEQPERDYISDTYLKDSMYYLIQNRIYNDIPDSWDNDSYSDLLIVDENGQIIDIQNLGGEFTKYHRILEAGDDYFLLAGSIKTDTCHYKLVISRYELSTKNLEHLSFLDLCHSTLMNIKIREGLNGFRFLEEYHSIDSNEFIIMKIYRIEADYSLTKVLEPVIGATFGVDFSGKGYVISDIGLYNFYDADFNYRKQKFNNESHGLVFHQTHTPFRHHLMLEQSIQFNGFDPDKGLQIRLIDSSLNLIEKLVIHPPHPYKPGGPHLPFYGGISIDNENEIWASANYSFQTRYDSAFFTIMKLDSNFNIICQHFIGYDSYYRMFGINALPNGGAIIFGNRLRDGTNINEGEDIYVLRVGENCELPQSVATDDPGTPLHFISVYPNPGSNNITFEVKGFDPSILSVELFSTSGQLMFEKKDLNYSIQVPDLPPGQYIYRIVERAKILGLGSWVKQD